MSAISMSRRTHADPVQVMRVSPEIAGRWLAKNSHNRNLRASVVSRYARDMLNGNWQFNGDAIRFDTTGKLLDGQHRLHAVVDSGTTQTFVVVTGIEPEAQLTMDGGVARSMGDHFGLTGESNATLLAAIIRLTWAWESGQFHGNVKPTPSEIVDYLHNHPEVRLSVDVAKHGGKNVPVAPSVFGACHYVCAQVDRLDAEEFFVDQLTNKIGITAGSASQALLARFANSTRLSDGRQRRTLANIEIYGYTITAWNVFRGSKRSITKLQAPKNGWNSANVPVPR